MVKADFDRDYYADLEIDSSASINEIKKQFRKLGTQSSVLAFPALKANLFLLTALVYHPDRNLGKESDITAKFQAIQSAHEVLTDPSERQRYDEARSRFRYTSASAFRSTKGNPYSNYGSEFPRPPKPPPYRPNRNPPPQSAGAARYSTFTTPKQSASAAAQEGPEARKSTFNAWESMKGHQKTPSSGYRTGSGPTWNTPKAAPKEYTSQPSREESSFRGFNAPPRAKPGFDDYIPDPPRKPSNPPPPTPKRNGFMPSNPGADEPSAGKGNYSTSRVNRNMPPPPPPRDSPSFEREREKEDTPPDAPPVNHNTRPSAKVNDPLRQFRTEEESPYEPRISTPYASAGGEKFDPFDAANVARSKSTRENVAEPKSRKPVPRAGSDSNSPSPRPNGTPKISPPKTTHAFASSPDSSDSGNGPEINPQKPRVFAKPRKPAPAQEQKQPDAAPPGTSNQNETPAQEEPKPQPSMYDTSSKYTASDSKEPLHHIKHASFPGTPSRPPLFNSKSMQDAYKEKYPGSFTTARERPTASPLSGGSSRPLEGSHPGDKDKLNRNSVESANKLNSFEAAQHNLVDRLVTNKERAQNSRQNGPVKPTKSTNHQVHNDKATYSFKSTPAETSNFAKRPSFVTKSQSAFSVGDSRLNSLLLDKLNAHANSNSHDSFSMKLDDETFSPTRPKINTTFSSEEWHGKFEAGGDYFVPERKSTQIPVSSHVRAQSASRPTRGRSPVKSRSADSKPFPASRVNSDTPIESPGGTKFSPEDWAEKFKPQTFAPPSIPSPTKPTVPARIGSRRPRVPIAKPTVGSAAVVIEDDSADDKPLFTGRNPKPPKPPASPDAMDVDSPPPATPAPPSQAAPPPAAPPAGQSTPASPPKANVGLKINTDQLKRSAAPSQSPIDAEGLGVEFNDMNIQDLLSSLNLPKPPTVPKYTHESSTSLSQGIYLSSFTAYMGDWDIFAKRMLLHLLARKNQNDGLGSNRWENPQGLDIYRRGLKEDGAVMSHWVAAMASHDQAMKDFAIHKERFNIAEGQERERPRKKTH
ncbi:hypothetical protein BOTNAR_0298g00160 [Botryotinia narcissicola]|uniref:J domain-containing protein n=1 Tax=Botryotinia narcissicola TaxID=278944 RepID=A0A4Z1I1N0_9HELO|nr:hypothetical protein BOTNAR_0298g00160 [Botryotinia narcissicola]